MRKLDVFWGVLAAGLGAAIGVGARRWRQQSREQRVASERAEAEILLASQMRDHVIASASHDLKTPLASIKLLVHLLKRDAAKGSVPAEQLQQRLTLIETNLNKISSLIGELLDTAKMQSGKPVDLRRGLTDLVVLARKVADSFEVTAGKHRIVVDSEEAELPAWVDAGRLERVLGNLIGNGLKYSPEGGDVTIRLRCEHSRDGDMAVVAVSDSGVGIPAEDLPHVFDWFRRARNVEHIAGTGVGLASAKAIVERHGGRIDVRSRQGRGTTVTLRLPLEPRPPAAEERREEPILPTAERSAADRG